MKKLPALKDSWIFLPIIPYFIVVGQNAPNIPIMDDYDAILSFLNDWCSAEWGQRFPLLFSQYNEHRLLYSKIVYVLFYTLTGKINFRALIFFADLQLCFIALISVSFIRKVMGKYWPVIAFIWMLCIFDLNTYESGSIAMYGMQNYGVMLLFFVSLFFYSLDHRWIIPAAIVQALCIYSSGNGMIGALFIALYTLTSDNKWKKLAGGVTAVVGIPVYFIGYVLVSQPNQLPFDIITILQYFVRMSGAPFSFDASLFWGIGMLIVLGLCFPYRRIRTDKKLWPFICILGFIVVSMGTASFFRACLRGAQFQTSRYLIYPQLLIGIILLFAALKWEGDKKLHFVLTGSLLTLLYTYSHNFEFGRFGFQRTAIRAETRHYWHPEQKKAAAIARTACINGIYCLEEER